MPDAQITSPNCGPRRDGLIPTLIVLHYTAMISAEAAIARLCDPVAEVSAHYVIARDGTVTNLVPEELRAWHAGAGEWRGLEDINSCSIGIELDNDGTSPFSAALMDALERLLHDIMDRWSIDATGVIGHADMAPGRKWDPGARFDWARLVRSRLAAGHSLVPSTDLSDNAFLTMAKQAGYTAPSSPQKRLQAMRLRVRPWATGPLEPVDFIRWDATGGANKSEPDD